MRRVFISRAIGQQKHWNGARRIAFGRAHYSWNLVAGMYQRGFEAAGLTVQEIVRPEIYQAPEAARQLWLTPDDVHLAVKPIEELRPLPHARNLYNCGWEFPEFSRTAYDSNPFMNQLRTLGAADAVLCWTEYTAANLRASGVARARAFAPLVTATAAADLPDSDCLTLDTLCAPGSEPVHKLSELLDQSPSATFFLTVLNPWDKRKQIDTMLSEFVAAASRTPQIRLLVKLVVDNVGTTLGNINEILRTAYGLTLKSEQVIFVSAALTDGQMAALYKRAHFYLCASSAEGLNLPVLESMLQGVPPVSTWNTAMGTYLDAGCSVEVASSALPMADKGHALHAHLQVTVFPPQPGSLEAAVCHAASLTPESRLALGRAAAARAESCFGVAAFRERAQALLG